MKFKFLALFFFASCYLFLVTSALAVYDPRGSANNKFGIHILTDNLKDASDSASLVNSSGGDWGYVTLLIESGNRDLPRWQAFFNDLRRRHLIPIVRIATKPSGNNWEVPYDKEYEAWAEFLDNLIWPTKNRYVVIYNEPNHAQEWGGKADPVSYAKALDNIINALKQKSPDFFILNAGFDASTPHQPPSYYDEEKFLIDMEREVPGIFNKLDGWNSHSYPNPGFVGSPTVSGRGSIKTYLWELETLKKLGLSKDLPVFITETGWKHQEGIKPDYSLPTADQVANYYKTAFEQVWSDNEIVAVTPFILDYQEPLFDHFSFKKTDDESFYSIFEGLANQPKIKGSPIQENQASLIKGAIYKNLVAGQDYQITLTFKNTGQTIWGEGNLVQLAATKGAGELSIQPVLVEGQVEPGASYDFKVNLKAPKSGSFASEFNLFSGRNEFKNSRISFNSEIKTPVLLKVKTGLLWKQGVAGNYLLDISGETGQTIQTISLDNSGFSSEIESKNLIPGYSFDFTLSKEHYQPKTIHGNVDSGVNSVDFGELQPDIFSVLLHPEELWKLLPFSK